MAQLFKPGANNIAKTSIVFGAITPVALGYFIAAISRSPANTKVDVPRNPPVPFSHQPHHREPGIDSHNSPTT